MALWLAFTPYEALHAPGGPATPPLLLRIGLINGSCRGATTLLLAPDGVRGLGIARPETGWREQVLPTPLPDPLAASGLGEGAWPCVAIAEEDGVCRLYHWMNAGPAGTLYTAFHRCDVIDGSPAALAQAFTSAGPALDAARPMLGDGFVHARWRRGMELERKYTFAAPVDIWALNRDLHAELRGRQWSGFIPEFNEEFHVWDYESAIFEVLDPPESRGYAGFIPQVDGRTTVKYKRFEEDSELRREDLQGDLDLRPEAYAQVARDLSGGTVRPLPGFRRKRFDCDLESVETGNAFGIFFDICRLLPDPAITLCQCEVEYLRTRAFAPHRLVEAEFELVCGQLRGFLDRHGLAYQEGWLSKLSFARAAADAGVPA